MKLFHPDNPVFAFISRLGDMLMLSLLWFVTSIPIITCGAATAALFDSCMKIIRSRDRNVISDYFHSFRSNFKQATVIFIIMAAVGGVIAADMYFWAHSEMPLASVMNYMSIGLAILFFGTLLYIFPVQATFENTVGATLRTAFLMALKHWPTSIGLLAGAAAIGYICYYFPAAAYVFLLAGTGTFGMIYSLSFVNIFKQYSEVIAEDVQGKKWDREQAEKTEKPKKAPAKNKPRNNKKNKIIS